MILHDFIKSNHIIEITLCSLSHRINREAQQKKNGQNNVNNPRSFENIFKSVWKTKYTDEFTFYEFVLFLSHF